MFRHKRFVSPALAGALPLLLVACAGLPADRGYGAVARATAARGLTLPEAADRDRLTERLLAQPLTPSDAVTLALLHDPALRAATARLGFAAAEVYEAARIANPVLSLSRLSSSDPAAASAQIGIGVALSFTDLLLLPARSRLAEARFAAVKLEVGDAALKLASEVERAWYRTAAAQRRAALLEVIARQAEDSADLAARYAAAGNLPPRVLAQERAAAAQIRLDQSTAAAEARLAEIVLQRRMGLPADTRWMLGAGFTLPGDVDPALDELLPLARDSRLDLAAARAESAALASAYGLASRTRLLGPIEAGFDTEKETDGSRISGPTLALTLPLFDWGEGRRARAQAEFDRAQAATDALALDVDAEVASAHAALTTARARLETYQQSLIPNRDLVLDQTRRETNYMLSSVFELIGARQQAVAARLGWLDALRDWWLARIELSRAVGRQLPSPAGAEVTDELVANPVAPADYSGAEPVSGVMPEQHHHHHEEARP